MTGRDATPPDVASNDAPGGATPGAEGAGAEGAGVRAKAATFWASALGILVADVVSKYLAYVLLQPTHVPREVLGDWVRLTLLYNPGAAFGLHLGAYSRWIFMGLTVLALWVLWRLYRETHPADRLRALALGLVVGGALGNLVNRVWYPPGVVDWIDVGVGDLRWPTFNVADIGVSVGAFLLAWVLWGDDPGKPPRAPAAEEPAAEERS